MKKIPSRRRESRPEKASHRTTPRDQGERQRDFFRPLFRQTGARCPKPDAAPRVFSLALPFSRDFPSVLGEFRFEAVPGKALEDAHELRGSVVP